MKRKEVLIIGIFLVLLIIFFSFYFNSKNEFSSIDSTPSLNKKVNFEGDVISTIKIFDHKEKPFSITPDYPIKKIIPLRGEAISVIELMNYDDVEHTFSLELKGLEGIANLSQSGFLLGPNEATEVQINFKGVSNNSESHVGKLVIKNSFFVKEIFFVIIFEDISSDFVVIQQGTPKYSDVSPGERLGVDIKLYDLSSNIFLKELNMNYEIKNFDDEVILSSEEKVILEKQYAFSKYFEMPEDISYGSYVLITSSEYQGVETISAYIFEIDKKRVTFIPEDFEFFIILIFVFILVILFLFFYFIKTRDSLLFQLKKQQSEELKGNLKLLSKSEKEIKKTKRDKKKSEKIKKIKEAKKRVTKKLKKKHEKEKKELKKITKKKAKKDYINKKLKEWKKQGYKLPWAKQEVEKISGKRVNKKIQEWKKQGFDTSVLNN